jgi:hypothetical protein
MPGASPSPTRGVALSAGDRGCIPFRQPAPEWAIASEVRACRKITYLILCDGNLVVWHHCASRVAGL